jgi:hypothetical protein
LIVELPEVDVEPADTKESLWLLEADHLVEFRSQANLGARWRDRNGENHARRPAGSEHPSCSNGSSTGGDPVVDDDHGSPLHGKGLALAAVYLGSSFKLLGLAGDDRL